jgi:hypothetical protein
MKSWRFVIAVVAALAALAALPLDAWPQCPPRTTVSDTLYNADGSPAAGRVAIAWPTFQIGSCQVIAGQVSVTVSNGAFTAQLYPNDAAVPAGTSYRVTYYLKSGRVTTEYWVVPASATPVNLAAVRSASVPVPSVMFSQAQVTNLVADLGRKVELPAPCPAGKFLQANGSASPPQVSCVDGTGAPLAGSAQSGTVKTDVDEADPRVYTKASTDTLLAAKADAVHGHAAADVTSGTLDPARLPAPTSAALGGVRSGSCAGTDKVSGITTGGQIACSPDQSGGAGSQHQVNGADLTANDPVNFQDTATIAFANPSAGNVQASVKDGSVTATKLSVAAPTNAQLSGVGDANISAGALSPDRISGTAEVQANRGAANGYASLNASQKVVQDPASAQTAPAAAKIPRAGGSGTIDDGWLSSTVTKLGPTIELDGAEVANLLPASKGGTGANNAATSGRFLKGNGTSFVTSNGPASGTGSCANQFVRGVNSDAAPTCEGVALGSDVTGTLPVANGGTGAASAAAARGNLGVVTWMGNLAPSTWNPADATAYSIGVSAFAPQTGATDPRTFVVSPVAGTVATLTVYTTVEGTLGSGETVTLTLQKNGSNCNLTVTQTWNASTVGPTSDTTNACTIAIGDRLSLRQSGVTWATNPTSVRVQWAVAVRLDQ